MREATLRDFFLGAVAADKLAGEVRDAIETVSPSSRRIHIEDLRADEDFTITAPMLLRLCDAVLAREVPASALETIAFAVIASDHLGWDESDELVARVLYDWASPEINWELTLGTVQMFRDWLTGEIRPPSEPEVTTDTFTEWGFITRTEKVRVHPSKG